jgi:hypothetical protein
VCTPALCYQRAIRVVAVACVRLTMMVPSIRSAVFSNNISCTRAFCTRTQREARPRAIRMSDTSRHVAVGACDSHSGYTRVVRHPSAGRQKGEHVVPSRQTMRACVEHW